MIDGSGGRGRQRGGREEGGRQVARLGGLRGSVQQGLLTCGALLPMQNNLASVRLSHCSMQAAGHPVGSSNPGWVDSPA